MAWVPRHKRVRTNDAEGSPDHYACFDAVPYGELAIRWLNHQYGRMPTAIKNLPRRRDIIMTAPRLLAFGTLALFVSISASYGGPCTEEIRNWQARIDAKAHAMAAAGPTGRQVGASTHVQPTPRSIGVAEEKLGEVSAGTVAAVRQAMLRARAADSDGDKNACEQALAEVQRAIGP